MYVARVPEECIRNDFLSKNRKPHESLIFYAQYAISFEEKLSDRHEIV